LTTFWVYNSSARNSLTNTKGWTITDAGATGM